MYEYVGSGQRQELHLHLRAAKQTKNQGAQRGRILLRDGKFGKGDGNVIPSTKYKDCKMTTINDKDTNSHICFGIAVKVHFLNEMK